MISQFRSFALIFAYASIPYTSAVAQSEAALNTHLFGWGHSCSGELSLSKNRMSWKLPYSNCSTDQFKVVKVFQAGPNFDRLYKLESVGANCSYPYVELYHTQNPIGLAWSVEGYPKAKNALLRNHKDSLYCQLEERNAEGKP